MSNEPMSPERQLAKNILGALAGAIGVPGEYVPPVIDTDRKSVKDAASVFTYIFGSCGEGMAEEAFLGFMRYAIWTGTVEDRGWACTGRDDLLIAPGHREYALADKLMDAEAKKWLDRELALEERNR